MERSSGRIHNVSFFFKIFSKIYVIADSWRGWTTKGKNEILKRTLDVPRSWRRKEVGTLPLTPEGKWESTATRIVERFKETGHPVFKKLSALSRGILKKIKETPYTSMPIHRTPNSCSDSIFLWISSVFTEQSQAGCVEFGQWPNEKEPTSEQLLKNVKPEEVNSLVQTPRSDDPAAGNRLRESLQRRNKFNFPKVCEDASFFERVSIVTLQNRCRCRWLFWRSISSMQRVCTPRAALDSRIYAATPGRTIIGPVIQVHIKHFFALMELKCGFHSRQVTSRRSRTQSPRVLNYFWKDLLQKKVNLVL